MRMSLRGSVWLLIVMLVPIIGRGDNAHWTPTGSMATGRANHTATALGSGEVLVVAGDMYSGAVWQWGLASAEIYDPNAFDPVTLTTGTWRATGSLSQGREYGFTATRLQSGKVLVVGGGNYSYGNLDAELYDPDAIDPVTGLKGTWSSTGLPSTPRIYHTATLLPSGKVLVAGGWSGGTTAELYDPDAIDSVTGFQGTFIPTGSLATERYGHTATLLDSGKVFVVGGGNGGWGTASAEIYDPDTIDSATGFQGTFSPTGPLAGARINHVATLLPKAANTAGKVLVVGNDRYYGDPNWGANSAELFDPEGIDPNTGNKGTWSVAAPLNTPRVHGHSAALVESSGKVLIVGGCAFDSQGWCAVFPPPEVYNPNNDSWTETGSLAEARYGHTETWLPTTGKILVVGGALVGGGTGYGENRRSAELH